MLSPFGCTAHFVMCIMARSNNFTQQHRSFLTHLNIAEGRSVAVANQIMANKGAVPPVSAKMGIASKRSKASASEAFAVTVLEFLMGMFPAVSHESMTCDLVATGHAVTFLLMQNVNVYRLNFHSWNFHIFALSLLLLTRALVSHWMLRMRHRDDVGSQLWWMRLVLPLSHILNCVLMIERIRLSSFWASLALGLLATLCFAPATARPDALLGVQLTARLRFIAADTFNIFLLASVFPVLVVKDPHLYYDKMRCAAFAVICLFSSGAIGVTRACVAAYLPFLTKGGALGSWLLKADIKACAAGKFSSVRCLYLFCASIVCLLTVAQTLERRQTICQRRSRHASGSCIRVRDQGLWSRTRIVRFDCI
jgi:hypothetical protein